MLFSGLRTHLLCLTATFNDEDVCIDVFHTHPVGKRESGVSPDPVHHCSQLHQERHQPKPTQPITSIICTMLSDSCGGGFITSWQVSWCQCYSKTMCWNLTVFLKYWQRPICLHRNEMCIHCIVGLMLLPASISKVIKMETHYWSMQYLCSITSPERSSLALHPYPWNRKRLRWLYFLVRKLPRIRVG